MNEIAIQNRQAEATAREILEGISDIWEGSHFSEENEEFFNEIYGYIKEEFLYESEYFDVLNKK